MNPQLICQLASQRVAEAYQGAQRYQPTAGGYELRESVKERAGWALINAGLKLIAPRSPRRHTRPRPAGL